MATSEEFINVACARIGPLYDVRYKKMFGEYMVYANEKPVLLVCNHCVFVKILPEVEHLFAHAQTGVPYKGAKDHYILDIQNGALVQEAVAVLERVTPVPKKRKK